jgi:hypothetical protein
VKSSLVVKVNSLSSKTPSEGFSALLEGKGDDYPEAAFYMQGTL